MLNTYGIHSINRETFNQRHHEPLYYSREQRNIVVTGFRIHNLVLNVLGYIPGVSTASGCVRIATGLTIIGLTVAYGQRKIEKETRGAIIGRWYDEAIATGIAQIARGALEAFVSFGRIANAILDIIATPFNIRSEFANRIVCTGSVRNNNVDPDHAPHDDVEYMFLPFNLLKLA